MKFWNKVRVLTAVVDGRSRIERVQTRGRSQNLALLDV